MSISAEVLIFILVVLFCLIIAVGLVASFLLIIEQLNNQPEDVRDREYH